MTALDFQIDVSDPAGCRLHVALEFDRASAARPGSGGNAVELFLPAWTPGSYLIREYARHLSRVAACDAATGEQLACAKTAKNRWRIGCGPATARLRVTYSVYAHELTVRTADVTAEHAYWNNACVLLWPVGRPELDCRLQVTPPAGWDGVSGLPSAPAPAGSLAWTAPDLDHAIDGPCLLGSFDRIEFTVLGVAHVVALDGLAGVAPPATLADDLGEIVEAAAEVFGGSLPYDDYVFLCLFADEGYGGLEHRNSCTLLTRRTALADDDGYREFLALCAHELFHVWNVKRMRPRELEEFDYERENYTPMLWLAEGWTAYYDDLLCLRAGRFTAEQYLAVAAKNIRRVMANPGRHRMSLAESSFDAWIRLYRPDENTRNSSQNYYVNGAVAAMCLDLTIRRDTAGSRSLDDVMRELWASTYELGRGYTLADVLGAVEKVAGRKATELLETMTQHELEPPLVELFSECGLTCRLDKGKEPQLGIAFAAGATKIASVTDGSPAAEAGLHPGDEILALEGLRVTEAGFAGVFRAVARAGEPLDVLLARRGVVQTLRVVPAPTTASVALEVDRDAAPERAELRAGWLRSRGSSE